MPKKAMSEGLREALKVAGISAAALVVVAVLVLLSGCQAKQEIAEFMSPQPNTLYRFRSDENENASYDVFYDFIDTEAGFLQRRLIVTGLSVSETIRDYSGFMQLVFTDNGTVCPWNLSSLTPNTHVAILAQPIQAGTSWSRLPSGAENNMTSEITALNVPVETPAGTFSAVEITVTAEEDGAVYTEYMAPGIGLIKTVRPDYTTYLYEITEDYHPEVTADFVTPGEDGAKNREARNYTLTTNTDMYPVIKQALAEYYNGGEAVFGMSAELNKIDFTGSSGRLKADFAGSIIPSGVDEADERNTLQCIAESIGAFYGVKSVAITVDGAAYQSDNLSFENGEYMDLTALEAAE